MCVGVSVCLSLLVSRSLSADLCKHFELYIKDEVTVMSRSNEGQHFKASYTSVSRALLGLIRFNQYMNYTAPETLILNILNLIQFCVKYFCCS